MNNHKEKHKKRERIAKQLKPSMTINLQAHNFYLSFKKEKKRNFFPV